MCIKSGLRHQVNLFISSPAVKSHASYLLSASQLQIRPVQVVVTKGSHGAFCFVFSIGSTRLDSASRGHWGDTARGRGFGFQGAKLC